MGFVIASRLAIIFIVFATSVCSSAMSGQSTSSPAVAAVQRDVGAIAVIQAALTRLGGEGAFASIHDTSTEATCTRVSMKRTDTHRVRWISAGAYFRVDGGSGDTRGAFNGPQGRMIIFNGKPLPLEERSARAMKQIHLPSLLLRASLANQSTQFEVINDENLPSGSAAHIRITDLEASANSFEPVAEDWYFDTHTGLPIKLKYSVQGLNSVRRFVDTTIDYGSFKTDAATGLVIPTSFARTFEGGPTTTCVIAAFSVNTSPNPLTFTNQAGSN